MCFIPNSGFQKILRISLIMARWLLLYICFIYLFITRRRRQDQIAVENTDDEGGKNSLIHVYKITLKVYENHLDNPWIAHDVLVGLANELP